MQLWPGTVVVQGHSLAPCIIPIGTVFYHGRGDASVPVVPEWLAFDFEHAYRFAGGREPHVLTLVTKRALRVLDFDGLRTSELSKRLCTWGAKNGIDGFIRMEVRFADSFDLLSSLAVIPQEERTKDGGGRRGPGGRFPVQRPEGWVGSLPTDSGAEVEVTGKWHDRAPGETRVRVQYDKFVSFYDPAVTSLVDSRRGKPREEHNMKLLSKADAQMKLAELEAALARPWDAGSGVDWASIVHVVSSAGVDHACAALHHLDTPGADGGASKAWLTPVVERSGGAHPRAVEDVMQQICRRLARVFYLTYDIEEEEKQLHALSIVNAVQVEVADLMAWLDWAQVWVKCKPACSTEVGNMCRPWWHGRGLEVAEAEAQIAESECIRRPNA
ncbi:hypothetical protein K438DRAFT_1965813 [Mycena galopus ATCC 62051]|nr:hypothetical protein K438DRAFT_1965813 [Mycena galopus ATCC 62051]